MSYDHLRRVDFGISGTIVSNRATSQPSGGLVHTCSHLIKDVGRPSHKNVCDVRMPFCDGRAFTLSYDYTGLNTSYDHLRWVKFG